MVGRRQRGGGEMLHHSWNSYLEFLSSLEKGALFRTLGNGQKCLFSLPPTHSVWA